jgi:hypothetical protein
LAALTLGGGWVLWALGKREIAVSEKGIELRGVGGRRVAWTDLDKVETYLFARRSALVFKGKGGQSVPVDSSLNGWEEFVEKAPDMAGQARPALERALARIAEREFTPRGGER